jgi:hypothetical protein
MNVGIAFYEDISGGSALSFQEQQRVTKTLHLVAYRRVASDRRLVKPYKAKRNGVAIVVSSTSPIGVPLSVVTNGKGGGVAIPIRVGDVITAICEHWPG